MRLINFYNKIWEHTIRILLFYYINITGCIIEITNRYFVTFRLGRKRYSLIIKKKIQIGVYLRFEERD